MKYTKANLIERIAQGESFKYILFWGHHPSADGSITKTCFSQWWDCKFTVDGIEYHTAEQYMMAQKAVVFGDEEILAQIMAEDNPGAYKKLGRMIRNFDPAVWNKKRTEIVIKGNYAKFTQNPELKEFLLNTGNRVIVEASPRDTIWGIGYGANNPNSQNPSAWRGTNLLGFCLMEVRDMIRGE